MIQRNKILTSLPATSKDVNHLEVVLDPDGDECSPPVTCTGLQLSTSNNEQASSSSLEVHFRMYVKGSTEAKNGGRKSLPSLMRMT